MEIQVNDKNRIPIIPDSILQECVLPDFLFSDLAVYSCIPKSVIAMKTWSTLIHLYEALYDTIQSGRYNLFMSFKHSYEEEFRFDNENDQFLKCQFLNSALMHYNSAFDISLECIWIGFGLYRYIKNEGVLSLNSKEETERILSLCSYNMISSFETVIDTTLFKELKSLRRKQQKIANWTNNLKHRGNLVYEDFLEEAIIFRTITKDGIVFFDSSKTQSHVSTSKVMDSLRKYHTYLVPFIQHMDKFFKDRIFNSAKKVYNDQT